MQRVELIQEAMITLQLSHADIQMFKEIVVAMKDGPRSLKAVLEGHSETYNYLVEELLYEICKDM